MSGNGVRSTKLEEGVPGKPVVMWRFRCLDVLKSPMGAVCVVGLSLLMLTALLADVYFGAYGTDRAPSDRLLGFSAGHLFGTDELGRDIFARVLLATKLSLALTVGATVVGVVGGTAVGLGASMLPSPFRRWLVGFMELLLAFPWLLMVLFFTLIWGASSVGTMIAIGLAGIPNVCRLVYNMSSAVVNLDYVKAAKISSVPYWRILTRHVLPNILNPLLVQSAAVASVNLLSFAALSYLGLGVQAPQYDWGRLLSDAIPNVYTNPMGAIGPGLGIIVAGFVFTLLSDVLSTDKKRNNRDSSLQIRRSISKPASTNKTTKMAAIKCAQNGSLNVVESRDKDTVSAQSPTAISRVDNLCLSLPSVNKQDVPLVENASLSVYPGEIVGLVGESGSGKSLTAKAMIDLVDKHIIVESSVRKYRDIDLNGPLTASDLKSLGTEIGVVFQDPLTSLNPALKIGTQLTEVPQIHLQADPVKAREVAIATLEQVEIPNAAARIDDYPHQLSGGMQQRAMIAMALAGNTRLFIADEPTTALDVTVQRQVLNVLKKAQNETNAGMLFISHDIALVSSFCDRVVVMKDGRVVEEIDADRLLESACHPYTKGLVECLPTMHTDRDRPLPVIT